MAQLPFILADLPIRLEYLSALMAAGIFAGLALPIIFLGMRSLNGLGPVRKWVAIGVRLLVLLLMVLILGGVRYQRRHTELEVLVLRDISQSTNNVEDFPGKSLQTSLDDYLLNAAKEGKKPDDRIGLVSFQNGAMIDYMPNTSLSLDAHAIRDTGNGTDIASAIQLGLATLNKDRMHRMVLISDGNPTQGDTNSAVAAAAAQHVPIDVVPLRYNIRHEVMIDKFIAPTWKRENEPFSLTIIVQSTNSVPVTGKLTVLHQGVPLQTVPVTLKPGPNPITVSVPPLASQGVHQFHATFEPDESPGTASGGKSKAIDTLASNNSANAFTFVKGKGQILYVDNVPEGRGNTLLKSLNGQGIEITDANHITPDQFPNSLIQLENYDAVILANVPYGPAGLSEQQQANLASYVHDLGGGLVMIGGPETFGAGGWQGRKLEEVLPVNMDIPAQRQIPKGALVLVMHSCEFEQGNYWGEQCAIKAIETLSTRDEIGIVSYGWGGPGGGGSQWDFPLAEKGDGSKPIAAAKKMQLGDMPSFEECLTVAYQGSAGSKGLKDSDARQKHVIIISDGDPQAPSQALVQKYLDAKITVSTVSVQPHMGDASGLPPNMKKIAEVLLGKAYGPINGNFNQLPQIFVKEATVVRRSLIFEDQEGIKLTLPPSSSDTIKGLAQFPSIFGMVLTSRKNNPQIELPIVGGKNKDPVLAHWQTGLGRALVYTSDANNQWGAGWLASGVYDKFWVQAVRAVARPPMSSLFDVQTTQEGDKGHIVVEAMDKSTGFMDFLNIVGKVAGPDSTQEPADVHLVQTGPGRYEATFKTPQPGTYVAAMQYRGQGGEAGMLLGGLAMNTSPELRDLQSNEAVLTDIAQRTGGRVLPPFDSQAADWFTRQGVLVTSSPLPVWDVLLPFLIGLMLIDVATRRIAWDWVAIRRYLTAGASYVQSLTATQAVETTGGLDALRKVREDGTTATTRSATASPMVPPLAKPDPSARFQAPATLSSVEGDIAQVVGGATNQPIPAAPKKVEPKGNQPDSSDGMSSLLQAKRRAQEKIRQKERGEK